MFRNRISFVVHDPFCPLLKGPNKSERGAFSPGLFLLYPERKGAITKVESGKIETIEQI